MCGRDIEGEAYPYLVASVANVSDFGSTVESLGDLAGLWEWCERRDENFMSTGGGPGSGPPNPYIDARLPNAAS